MEFKTLKNIDLEELLSVFNHSFSDYVIPFHLTREILDFKIATEKIDLSLSVGAFEDDCLVAFILQAEKIENGRGTVYNAGTGVIPESRGKGLVRKMYDFIIPVLKERNINTLLLEVIDNNQQAIRAYENLGFTIVRRLLCFHGNTNQAHHNSEVIIKELADFQWEKFSSFWDVEPSWQGSAFVVKDMKKNCIILGAFKDEKLVGYVVYNSTVRKVYQIAVDKNHRRQGIGSILFEVIKNNINGQPISLNNVDEISEDTAIFLQKIGLNNHVSQFEMKRSI
ncbi:GNAT family N-acetyltransferase [Chryseobacterium sp. G0186]|uniref:GNAT family N-acetyltransferase n=1 Tax=Chryseobacterium sp. G0186 TaxID=2487064 RepID=UPI000F4DE610|nr:GNAT family N-acetyltransferase [Chryseobacterium sp. G0186]AZA78062.1 GNAT family N-acetyltransferase [Chryseobacterium sp. G0186]